MSEGVVRVVRRASARRVRTSSIPIMQTDDGLHLADSILWFDSKQNGELSFLSSATPNYTSKVAQVIATEETVSILETTRRQPNTLVCQYNRPFSIGRLKMELLPSGSVLGGASLYVETTKGRLLYAPRLLAERTATARQMQLKKAHTLVLGAHHPEPTQDMPNRKKESERFLQEVHNQVQLGRPPVIFCDPIATAQEITKMLTDADIPLAVHSGIHRINRVYQSFGAQLGPYTRFSKYSKDKTLLLPLSARRSAIIPFQDSERPIFCIEDNRNSEQTLLTPLRPVDERFYLSSSCDGAELREVVCAVAPKELYLLGPYAKRYVDEFQSLCPVVKPLFVNNQPTLF